MTAWLNWVQSCLCRLPLPGRTHHPVPQPEGEHFYARKICKEDGHLDWTQRFALSLPDSRPDTWPGAFTYLPEGDKKIPPQNLEEAEASAKLASASGNDSPG